MAEVVDILHIEVVDTLPTVLWGNSIFSTVLCGRLPDILHTVLVDICFQMPAIVDIFHTVKYLLSGYFALTPEVPSKVGQ